MLTLTPAMEQEIARGFARAMEPLPAKSKELERYFSSCGPDHVLCLQFLYGFLPLSDVLTFPPEEFDSYVTPALKARERLPYGPTVPAELFLNYVLMPRVNNEHLDLSRNLLQEALWPRVLGKSMAEAALEVNYWCCEQVTYHPSDDRTLGPLGVMKSTLGRCGEESTFTVSALRSVGIPARQCYVPRWSHCDDNHAWVELWAEGRWHYLGACEPEPVLDKGWFTPAASRAMVIHSRTLSTLVTEEAAVRQDDSGTLIHTTAAYASTVALQVRVLNQGIPVPGVRVQFQIVNYSECFPIYEQDTDETGAAVFSTGLGSLRLQIFAQGKLLTRVVDTRQETRVTLDLSDGRTLAERQGNLEDFDLIPPAETLHVCLPAPEPEEHRQKLIRCDTARAAYVQSFRKDLPPEAKGNWQELEKFLVDAPFPREEKLELLSTLRPKDYLDCTEAMLSDTLACARAYRDAFPPEIYRSCILAPRVASEMLLPVRPRLRALIQKPFANGEDLLRWLKGNIQIVEDEGLPTLVPDCAKAVAQRCINKSAFGVLFVTLCRTFGIPARQNPNTLAWEWMEEGTFHRIDPSEPEKQVSLLLRNASGQSLPYGQRFTLGRFRGDRYETLRFDDLTLEEKLVAEVPVGDYALITTTRQIDGTVSARIRYETIQGDTVLPVIPPEDQTASRIRHVPLPLPEGAVESAFRETQGRRMALFLEPGKEPTEHLLQELLQCREECGHYGLLLFAPPHADPENETLKRVLSAFPHALLRQAEDPAGLGALRQAMGIGDQRLPFSLALDGQGQGLYACANYNIHTAQTLLNVQRLSEEMDRISL